MAEKTLTDVVDALVDVKQTGEATEGAIQKNSESVDDLASKTLGIFKMFDRKFDEDRLAAEEARRENNRTVPGQSGSNGIPGGANVDDVKIPFLGLKVMMANIGATIARFLPGLAMAFAGFMSPLKGIARLVMKGGPIGATLALLWAVFKDIGDNPQFQAAIQGISNVWNDEIIPTWQRLKEAFSDFLNSEGMELTIASISGMWTSATNWFSNTFKPLMQFLLVDALNIFGDLLSGLMDSINIMLDGDFVGGVLNIWRETADAVYNTLNSLATSIVKMFGIEFSEGSSLFSVIGDLAGSITTSITNMLVGIKDTIIDGLGGGVEWVSGIFAEIQAFGNRTSLRYDNIMDNVEIGFQKVGNFIKNIPDQLLRMIGNILDFEIPRLSLPYDNFLLGQGEIVLFPGGRPFAAAGDMGAEAQSRITARNDALDASVARLESNIASRLEALNAETAANRGAAGTNVIISAPSSSSNVQNTNTSVIAFPSPFNDYAPQ